MEPGGRTRGDTAEGQHCCSAPRRNGGDSEGNNGQKIGHWPKLATEVGYTQLAGTLPNMDLSLSQSQEMLKATARGLVEREYPNETLVRLDATETGARRDLWKKTTDAGWLGILVPTRVRR